MKDKKFSQTLYEVAFIIMAAKNVLDSSNLFNRPEWFDLLLTLLFFGVIVWKLTLQSYSWRRIFLFGVIGTLCVYTCLVESYYYLIYSFLGIMALQDVDLRQVLRKTAYTKIGILSIHIIVYLFIMVVTPDQIELVYRNGIGRHYFLMGHPNTFSMYVLWTSLEFVYANYEKLKRRHLLIVLGINALTYYFTNSNTGILVTSLTVFLLMIDKSGFNKEGKFIKPVSKYIFAVLSITIPLFVASYQSFSGFSKYIFITLNDLFTGRLLFGAYGYANYGFTLFGRVISFPEKSFWQGYWLDSIYFDNSYLWMFILYGYVYLVLISAGFILIAKKTTNLEKILLISFACYGVMEAYIINAAICFPMFFIGKYLYQYVEEKRDKKRIYSKKTRAISKNNVDMKEGMQDEI